MKNKSWQTTTVGAFGMLILLISMGLVYFGKATLTEVGISLAFVTTFLSSLAAMLAKDKNKTGLPKE
jgi:hypothetical protein